MIESQDIDGTEIGPWLSWDAKGALVLSIMGGLVDAVKERL